MLTWAYAWFLRSDSVSEYLPGLFALAMLCDVAIVGFIAVMIRGPFS